LLARELAAARTSEREVAKLARRWAETRRDARCCGIPGWSRPLRIRFESASKSAVLLDSYWVCIRRALAL